MANAIGQLLVYAGVFLMAISLEPKVSAWTLIAWIGAALIGAGAQIRATWRDE